MRFLLFVLVFVVLSSLVAAESVTKHHYVGSSLLASDSGEGLEYFHRDRLGSNRVVTGDEGIVDEFLSLPFGQALPNSGVKYGFTGKEQDKRSGLHYFGARYYDSSLGVWSKVDPVSSEPPYQYVGNNPINLVDPTGMAAEPKLKVRRMPHNQFVIGDAANDHILDKFLREYYDVPDIPADVPKVMVHGLGDAFTETYLGAEIPIEEVARRVKEAVPEGTTRVCIVSCEGNPQKMQQLADLLGMNVDADVSGSVLSSRGGKIRRGAGGELAEFVSIAPKQSLWSRLGRFFRGGGGEALGVVGDAYGMGKGASDPAGVINEFNDATRSSSWLYRVGRTIMDAPDVLGAQFEVHRQTGSFAEPGQDINYIPEGSYRDPLSGEIKPGV